MQKQEFAQLSESVYYFSEYRDEMLQIAYKTQQFQFVGEITPQFVMQILKCVSKRAAVVLSIFNQLDPFSTMSNSMLFDILSFC